MDGPILHPTLKCGYLLAFFAGTPMPPDRIQLRTDSKIFSLSALLPRHPVNYCRHAYHHEFFLARTRLGDNLAEVVVKMVRLFSESRDASSTRVERIGLRTPLGSRSLPFADASVSRVPC
jgi:hypothetical protein